MTPYDIDFYPECCIARVMSMCRVQFGGEQIPISQEVRQHEMIALDAAIARAHQLINQEPAEVERLFTAVFNKEITRV